ncbi:MAG: CCA tRNA nucleotidyltransferase [Myxococcales bacterium]|nr:CCA tRNA nucleotidyltransferase [Myxococcales bacterium]MCB9534258.1 CCA tRNA nucleotidyltransferase [Myxococcales bacterium]
MIPRFAPFASLFGAFRAAGHELYFVGGAVRDLVMGLAVVGDVDLATDATPPQIKEVLVEAGYKAFPIGERFGTITTLVDSCPVEITTYRVAELYSHGSRHPDVRFGTDLAADLARRDLSINAMAMDADGRVVDPFDGRRGIRERLLEVPGGGFDNTVSILRDDPLRLLRIARFAARLGFAPTDETTAAATAQSAELEHISHERWKAELDKLLVAPHVRAGLEWLVQVGALGVVLPAPRPIAADDLDALGAALEAAPAHAALRWAVLLAWGVGAGDWHRAGAATPRGELAALASDSATRFRFSNDERKLLAALLTDDALLPPNVPELADRRALRRFAIAIPGLARERLAFARALATPHPETRAALDALALRLDELLAAGDPAPHLPDRFGVEVRGALGLDGRAVGAAIARVRDAIIDGDLPETPSVAQCLDFLRAAGD